MNNMNILCGMHSKMATDRYHLPWSPRLTNRYQHRVTVSPLPRYHKKLNGINCTSHQNWHLYNIPLTRGSLYLIQLHCNLSLYNVGFVEWLAITGLENQSEIRIKPHWSYYIIIYLGSCIVTFIHNIAWTTLPENNNIIFYKSTKPTIKVFFH